MRTEHGAVPGAAPPVPRSARIAGVLLVVIGVLNLLAGGWGLTVARDDLSTGVAVGLMVAGALTAVLGRYVGRGSLPALYLALVVFELLLIPRLITLGAPGRGSWVSLLLLLVLVGVLWWATIEVRRSRGAPLPDG